MLRMGSFVGEVKQRVPEPSTENYRQLGNAGGRRNSFSEEKAHQWVSPKIIHASDVVSTEQGNFINTQTFT